MKEVGGEPTPVVQTVLSTSKYRPGRRIRRVTGRDGGVDLDTIAVLSEKVSRRLDLEGFEPGPYALEVTTPGIERPLRRPRDFQRAVGEHVRVRTAAEMFEGDLTAADEEAVVLAAADGPRRIPLVEVASARTVVDWDAELRRSAR